MFSFKMFINKASQKPILFYSLKFTTNQDFVTINLLEIKINSPLKDQNLLWCSFKTKAVFYEQKIQ